MKFKLSSPLVPDYYLPDEYLKRIIGLYPFLKDMNISIIGDDLVIEINTLEELDNLAKKCKHNLVYCNDNDYFNDKLDGWITIYDDYLEW